MATNINSVLTQVLEKTKPSKDEIKDLEKNIKDFVSEIKKTILKKRIKAEIFVGGSFAKKTIIKKEPYDIDVFLRFEKKHGENGENQENLSKITESILKEINNKGKNIQKIPGSRDYFRIKLAPYLYIEIIPVKKITNQKEAENITDLSYFHVNYINKKIKNKKILDEIIIAKAFCHANKVYGAESYIRGFSGYGLELLIYYYKTFLNFIKAMVKVNSDGKDKLIIDIEKQYKNKRDILLDINSAKLNSPIILVDPTYKQRNVLAALSLETFKKFQEACRKFLKKPGIESFEIQKTNLEKIKNEAKKKKLEFIILKATTDRQEGDIAGSKLLKFHRHLTNEISKIFEIMDSGFEYVGKKTATYFFVVRKKPEIIKQGPKLGDEKNVSAFKKANKKTFIKNGRIYAKEKITYGIKDFLNKWEQKNKRQVSEMSIKELRVIG